MNYLMWFNRMTNDHTQKMQMFIWCIAVLLSKPPQLDPTCDHTHQFNHTPSPVQRDLVLFLQGMACVGRTKKCTIVPSNHFGPIPGIPVGTAWKFRVQVSRARKFIHGILLRAGS